MAISSRASASCSWSPASRAPRPPRPRWPVGPPGSPADQWALCWAIRQLAVSRGSPVARAASTAPSASPAARGRSIWCQASTRASAAITRARSAPPAWPGSAGPGSPGAPSGWAGCGVIGCRDIRRPDVGVDGWDGATGEGGQGLGEEGDDLVRGPPGAGADGLQAEGGAGQGGCVLLAAGQAAARRKASPAAVRSPARPRASARSRSVAVRPGPGGAADTAVSAASQCRTASS